MAYTVLHIQKNKGNVGGLGNHIDRVEGMEHTYPHADPKRKDQNMHLVNPGVSIQDAVNSRIKAGYTGEKTLRKDAVKSISLILSGSHEQMVKIGNSPDLLRLWVYENFKFLEEEYGKENVVKYSLHMDEKTPHIHATLVPITKDGRLSAKETIGNRAKLEQLHTRYAQRMHQFGLERGEKRDNQKHIKTADYRKQVAKAKDEASKLDVSKIKKLSPRDKTEMLELFLKTQILGVNLDKLKQDLGNRKKL